MKLDLSNSFDVAKAESYFEKLKTDKAKIEIKKVSEKRTLSQNKFLHVCLSYFCMETGYCIEESKQVFARLLPELMIYEKNGSKFRRSTATLSKEEMIQLIDFIRSFTMDQFGIYIPTSEEYIENQFQIEREIQNVK